MPYFNHNNIELYYEIAGRDDPLVLIAGIGCDIHHWQYVRDELAKRYQIIMLDNRGVGRSAASTESYSLKDMAEDVIGLLDHLNISRADILGHSMGGAVAQYLGYEYPERINRLIISHSFIKFRPSSLMVCQHDYLLQKQHADSELRATGLLPYIHSDSYLADEQNVNLVISTFTNLNGEQLASYLQQIELLKQIDTSKYLRYIRPETFLLGGRDDKFTPISDTIELNHKIFASKLMVIAGAHVPMIENPQEYCEVVLAYLRNRMVTVIEEHRNEFLNPISLNEGDEVIIGNEDSEYIGWVFCTAIKSNISGWVPKQLIKGNYADGGVVTEDYSAIELNVTTNQMVIIKKEVNEWAWCFNGETHGWLPLNKLAR